MKHRRPPIDRDAADPVSAAAAAVTGDIDAMVRRAVARRDVLLAFQPVVNAARPDRPAFYEGLVRLLDEAGHIIPAREFMAAVEVTETGRQIDCLALEMGFIALSRDPGLRLAINMSARSIGYARWMNTLRRGLSGDPAAAERLILEMSEDSAMLTPDITGAFLREFQAKGVTFALDDFGAGSTSFRHLREFMFDILKIDGQFIRGVSRNADNQCVTQALIGVGKAFGVVTIAESVESEADARFLVRSGIDCLQGYYIGAPSVTPPWHMPKARRSA
ncbi:MAG: EAL domain-containing protein [Rhodobacteraceae bacterium]|nr:EAL domain-containing protein [Paracoccaceae bacterium]